MTDTDLDGRVAIVTGAGRGLGRAEAHELARQGARVVVNDLGASLDGSEQTGSPAQEVAAEIRDAGGEAVAHHGDVADRDDADGLIDLALDTWGRLDVLVNNAGILRDRMVFTMDEDEWDAVIRVHLRGHFLTTRAATSHWRATSKERDEPVYARIINTASEAFLGGSPGQPNYAAAKAGIMALTLSTAHGCAKYGVRANAIAPRARTRMTEDVFGEAEGDRDPLAPEHVAPVVAFLASPAAAGISGQLFVAYGGFVGVASAPALAQRFDAEDGHWDVDELADEVGGYFAERDDDATFAATEILRAGG